MAVRPVFVPLKKAPFLDVFPCEFVWNQGLSVSQKQKNIQALHAAYNHRFPGRKVLEISSKSLQPLGVRLSAFNLTKFVPELEKSSPLECVFQGGKVFAAGGADAVKGRIMDMTAELKGALAATASADIRSIDPAVIHHRAF